MPRRPAALLALALTACTTAAPSPSPSPPEAPRAAAVSPSSPQATFDALERRLLGARSLRLQARLRSEGAVSSALTVTLLLAGARARMEVEGTMEGHPVKASLVSDGTKLGLTGGPTPITLDAPPALAEGLLICLTRIGILHHAAQLTEGEPPEQTGGGVRAWATVNEVKATPGGGLAFGIVVRGGSQAEATLELDPSTRLPRSRRQTVHFKHGDMRVEETYERFVLDDVGDAELNR